LGVVSACHCLDSSQLAASASTAAPRTVCGMVRISKLVADGADLRTAQTLLRHANLNTTAGYVQVADARRGEAIDRLDKFG
jgi:site-specific recombinase XerD